MQTPEIDVDFIGTLHAGSFSDNDINPDDHEVVWAAVGAQSGFVPFWIGEPDGWYGQQ
jgi:hypothetical protein